jgi:arabinose-5-phosphate isomerase
MPPRTQSSQVLEDARRVLRIEAQALSGLARRLDRTFVRAVEAMLRCRGRVVVTGLGKSGVIGQKLAATLASTGTPAAFLHAADAVHGDLGMVLPADVVLAISNSGETDELVQLLPHFRRLGTFLIALVGNRRSTLARNADLVLDVSVRREACPLGLAPTASTTAVLAMGDALAVSLLNRRGFRPEDFARLHPGGALGKSLIHVKDIMHTGAKVPRLGPEVRLERAIAEMTRKRFGCVGIVDPGGRLLGIFTDGDLRRLLGRANAVPHLTVGRVMTKRPVVARGDDLAVRAMKLMQDRRIFVLLVTDARQRLIGILHFLDLLDAGVI